jgi:hypothetical protein
MDNKDPTVSFSTLTSIRDNAITNWYTFPWSELVQLLTTQGHLVTENKDIALISPWTYKTLDEDFTPRKTDEGELWTIDGKPVVARLAENVKATTMLFFDFDGDTSISQAADIFKQYTYLGYTSYSHMSPSKERKDCFRVIVPLAQPITAQQLVDRRKAIYAQFAGVDKSCFSLARSFYIPSTAPERKHLTQLWKNDGELFDVLTYSPEVYIPPTHSPVVFREVSQNRIIESLKKIHLGFEPDWFKVACTMAANGYTYEQFCEVTIGHLMTNKDSNQCADKWKHALKTVQRGNSTSIGYLVNLCKQHGTWNPVNDARNNMKTTIRSAA